MSMVRELRENFELHIAKPLLRGISHLAAFFVSLLSGVVLALQATAVASLIAALVYATGLSLALGTRALYHRVRLVTSRSPHRTETRSLDDLRARRVDVHPDHPAGPER